MTEAWRPLKYGSWHLCSACTRTACASHAVCVPTNLCLFLRLQEALKAEIERKRKAKETQFGGRKFARLADLQAHPDGDADARPAAEEATLAHASGEARARLCVGQQCCCAVPDTTSTRPHPRRRARLCHSPQARCAPPAEAALRLTQTVRRRLWLTALSPLLRLPLRRPAPP